MVLELCTRSFTSISVLLGALSGAVGCMHAQKPAPWAHDQPLLFAPIYADGGAVPETVVGQAMERLGALGYRVRRADDRLLLNLSQASPDGRRDALLRMAQSDVVMLIVKDSFYAQIEGLWRYRISGELVFFRRRDELIRSHGFAFPAFVRRAHETGRDALVGSMRSLLEEIDDFAADALRDVGWPNGATTSSTSWGT